MILDNCYKPSESHSDRLTLKFKIIRENGLQLDSSLTDGQVLSLNLEHDTATCSAGGNVTFHAELHDNVILFWTRTLVCVQVHT
jgi:hypothetical protein